MFIRWFTLKPSSAKADVVRDQLGDGDDDLQMDAGEALSLGELEVAAHEQVKQPTGLASGRSEARVAAAEDFVAERGAKQRVPAEEERREFADESAPRGEGVFDDGFALKRRMQQRHQYVEQLSHLEEKEEEEEEEEEESKD